MILVLHGVAAEPQSAQNDASMKTATRSLENILHEISKRMYHIDNDMLLNPKFKDSLLASDLHLPEFQI